MKKRLIALVCAVVLCLSLVPARAINVGDVYFTSVNDKLCPLTMDTMPIWVNGGLYVPASVFDNTATGVDLGLYCSQSSTNNTVTLYSLRRMLVFDLSRGITYDQHSGENLSARAVKRNGRIFLPVKAVCEFFGLEDSYNYTQYGYLVRIKSDEARLNDADFIDAASAPMSNRLQELLEQQEAVKPPAVEQEPEEQIQPSKNRSQLCLGVRCETGEGLETLLDRLDRANVKAIFFVGTQVLSEQDDLIRRMVGSGHTVGLLAEEDTASENRQKLTQGNRLLAHVARTAATAALVPDGQRQTMEQENWVCWQQMVNGLPRVNERAGTYAQRIIQAIGTRRGVVCLTLDDSKQTANVISTLLQQLEQAEYAVIAPLETRL